MIDIHLQLPFSLSCDKCGAVLVYRSKYNGKKDQDIYTIQCCKCKGFIMFTKSKSGYQLLHGASIFSSQIKTVIEDQKEVTSDSKDQVCLLNQNIRFKQLDYSVLKLMLQLRNNGNPADQNDNIDKQ